LRIAAKGVVIARNPELLFLAPCNFLIPVRRLLFGSSSGSNGSIPPVDVYRIAAREMVPIPLGKPGFTSLKPAWPLLII
jgi:hypothetical protein